MPHVAPPWVGRLLLNPFRKLLEHPDRMLAPYVKEGMTVLEPGCGMGYFTLPLARMVGDQGKVITVDIQQAMLDGLNKRLAKSGLTKRVESRLASGSDAGVSDLDDRIDFVAAIHVVHETPDQQAFFKQVYSAMKTGARLLIIEPAGHVSVMAFQNTIAMAQGTGFQVAENAQDRFKRRVVFEKLLHSKK